LLTASAPLSPKLPAPSIVSLVLVNVTPLPRRKALPPPPATLIVTVPPPDSVVSEPRLTIVLLPPPPLMANAPALIHDGPAMFSVVPAFIDSV
jgi:hypothetical protein